MYFKAKQRSSAEKGPPIGRVDNFQTSPNANIARVWIPADLLPEIVLDNARGIHTHPQLQVNDGAVLMALNKILIPPGGGVPPAVLHKGIVRPQVHGHGFAANRAAGHKPRRHLHIPLLREHPAHRLFVVIDVFAGGMLPATVPASYTTKKHLKSTHSFVV